MHGRRLPARVSYTDQAAIILADNQETRDYILSALSGAHSLQDSSTTAQRFSHLRSEQRAILIAWATYQYSEALDQESKLHGPFPKIQVIP